MKKNNLGFVLAETFIVSTMVLAILVFMFLQIRTIVNGYNKSFDYNTVPGIYITKELKEFVLGNNYSDLESRMIDGYVILYANDSYYRRIFETANVKTMVISNGELNSLKEDESLSPKFLNYIKTLSDSEEYQYIVEFNDDTYATIKE